MATAIRGSETADRAFSALPALAGALRSWRQPDQKATSGRLVHGVAWSIAGSVVGQGSAFFGAVLLARILGKQAYGQFSLIQATLIAMTNMAGMGLGVTATKYVSEYRASQPDRAGRVLGLCSLVAILASCAFALVLLAFSPVPVQRDSELAWGLRCGAAYVFFVTLNGYQIGTLAGFEAFRAIGLISIVYGVAACFLSWPLAAVAGIRGAVLAQVGAAVLLWSLYQWEMRRECRDYGIRIDYHGAWRERQVLWQFSIPAASAAAVVAAATWWTNAVLVQTSGYGELAVFTAVTTMRTMVLFLPVLVGRVTTPVLNRQKSEGEMRKYRRTYWTGLIANGGMAAVVGIALIIGGPWVLGIFGREFHGSTLLVSMLVGSAVLEVIAGNVFQHLFTAGRLWRNFAIRLISSGVLALVAYRSTSKWGAVGLAAAYAASWSITLLLYLVPVRERNRAV